MNKINSIELNLPKKVIATIGDELRLRDGKTATIVRIVDTTKRQLLVRDEVGSPRIISEDDIIEILVRVVKKTGILARVAAFLNRFL